ncbi:unnamed protein product [Arabis nemorensis]|uniref:Pentacotripeptide-repeat region of PRORP domain-containing protein n=1 Tax=Arabis nemorensis TaxID=586526 RepID=A0A565AXJ0_9BRAS|nr:unnamed protein product [Arabis nemorensis]
MMRQKMTLSASQHGVHVDLIAKTKGLAAAENYFNNLDPCAKNHSTYRKLLKWYCRGLEEDKANAFFRRMDRLNLLISCSPFNDMMTLYMGLGQPEKVVEIVDDMRDRCIGFNYVSYGIWWRSSEGTAVDDLDMPDLPYDDERSCKSFRRTLSRINERGIVVAYL